MRRRKKKRKENLEMGGDLTKRTPLEVKAQFRRFSSALLTIGFEISPRSRKSNNIFSHIFSHIQGDKKTKPCWWLESLVDCHFINWRRMYQAASGGPTEGPLVRRYPVKRFGSTRRDGSANHLPIHLGTGSPEPPCQTLCSRWWAQPPLTWSVGCKSLG